MEHTRLEREIAEQNAGLLPFKAVRSRVPEKTLRQRQVTGQLAISGVLKELAKQANTVV